MLATILLLLPVQPCPEAHPVTAVHPQGPVSHRRDLFGVPESLADAPAHVPTSSVSHELSQRLPSLVGGPSGVLTYIAFPRKFLHDIRNNIAS